MTITDIPYDGTGHLAISGIAGPIQESTTRFDRVITVCQERIDDNISDDVEYDFFCMSDGPANGYGGDHSYELFEAAAKRLEYALKWDESVLIHCHMGQSRSVAVAAAALTDVLGLLAQDALDLIHEYRDVPHYPDRMLLEHLHEYGGGTITFKGHELA